jgi:hypothetical protein
VSQRAQSVRQEVTALSFEPEAVAETLAAEFPGEPGTTVIRVVTDCVAEFPDDDPMFIEQAARARLGASGE